MQVTCHLSSHLVWTLYILYRGVLVTSSFQGKEFLLAFPSSYPTNSSFDQRLSIANSDNLDAAINITMYKNSSVLLFHQKTLGVGQGCFGDCVNESLASSTLRLGGVIVRISSTGRIVVLAHSTSAGFDYDSFLVIPSANLSLVYSSLAECPSSFCLLIVASAAMKANVNITFCLSSQTTTLASLKYNNVTYFNGNTMTVILNSWETLEIVTDGISLGGSLIQSSAKIAVISGTMTLSNGVIIDYNVETVATRDQLGTEYVVVDCPTCGTTTYVKIVYNEPNTTLDIDTKILALKVKRDCIEYYTLKQQAAAVIRSDKPILVQLVYAEDNVVMTPTRNWGTYYLTVPSSQSKAVLITRTNCSSNFSFNGQVDSGLAWTLTGNGSFKYAVTSLGSYGTWLNVSAINCTFSGIVYSSPKPTMMWSLGWGPDFVPPVTNLVPTTSTVNTAIAQTSTISSAKYFVNTTTASTTTSSIRASTTTSNETASVTSSTTASNAKALPTSSTTSNASASITSSTTTSNATASVTSSTTASNAKASPTSSTTSNATASVTSSTTASIATASVTYSTTASNAKASPTSSTTSNAKASPTSSTTSNATASVTSSTTASNATASPTSSTTAFNATAPAAHATASPTTTTSTVTIRTTKETSASASTVILIPALPEASLDNATADNLTLLNTPDTPTLSTTTAQYSSPISGGTIAITAINSTAPIPVGFVCPCTCSYSSIQPSFWKYLRQKESKTREVIDRLILTAHAQSAQRMLKISTENRLMSETIAGAVVFILFMSIAVFVLFAPDLMRMTSNVIQLVRLGKPNFN